MIPYGRQDVIDEDIDAVISVLKSDFLTQGPVVPRFEEAIAAYCGSTNAVASNSATSSLHLACLALGLGEGDSLWTSPITFVASSNCALYCGASVDFVDIDPNTYNMSVTALEQKLVEADRSGKLPKVVVPVHLCGQPCDMAAIYALSQKYGFKIIEDASHAIGGKYRNEAVGNCRFSDITVFSFHPVKIITTAEGGMAVTNDDRLASRMRMLRSHGITRDAAEMSHEPDGSWYYEQIDLGFNYRLTEIQAALGASQLTRLDEYVARRHLLSQVYDAALSQMPLNTPFQHSDGYSARHLYVVRLHTEGRGPNFHRTTFEALRERGIGVNLHYIPVYRQPYYAKMGFRRDDFPEAEAYYGQAISLPMFATLDDRQQAFVIQTLGEILAK